LTEFSCKNLKLFIILNRVEDEKYHNRQRNLNEKENDKEIIEAQKTSENLIFDLLYVYIQDFNASDYVTCMKC
jgi:hypothetical protein